MNKNLEPEKKETTKALALGSDVHQAKLKKQKKIIAIASVLIAVALF